MEKYLLRIFFFLALLLSYQLEAQKVGEALPPWKPGLMDIHEISTGRGSSTFFMLPDGTTMLYDAGEFTQTNTPWRIPRYADAKPDSTRPSGQWITSYIDRLLKQAAINQIDYALLSHFHWDHMGQITDNSPISKSGTYKLTGLTTVAETIPIKKMLDRGWPDYKYPVEVQYPDMLNYRAFLKYQTENKEMIAERFKPGSNEQIVLKNNPNAYSNFEIRNLAANGEVWTGVSNVTRQHYPPLADLEKENYPNENMCSIAMRVSYGKFDYFTGGDLRGIPPDGSPSWQDLETPIAQVTGPVEASLLNHHGHIDSQNAFFVSALRPQVWLLSVWDSAHPGHMVYRRLRSEKLYPGKRDIFATGMHEANKLVLVGLDKLASDQGHIVLRVSDDGNSFKVIILDDSVENGKIKAIHGPYVCR